MRFRPHIIFFAALGSILTGHHPVSSGSSSNSSEHLDQYGGLKEISSSLHSTQQRWRVEKFADKWLFVDPENHGYFMIGMYVLNQNQSLDAQGQSYYSRSIQKYGDAGAGWAEQQIARVKSWGFNGLGVGYSWYALPTTLPDKLPFWGWVRPAYYAMANTDHYAPTPIKNILFGASTYYTGYRPGEGVGDYYDQNLGVYLQELLSQHPLNRQIKNSRYSNYMIGVAADDGDEMFGFGAGPDFATVPPGHNNTHLGWLVLTMSPSQTANRSKQALYNDTTVYCKKGLRDQLIQKYRTIMALNSAWGSHYTTFDSSGIPIEREAVAQGDGVSLKFTKTLAASTVTRFTLQIYAGQNLIAGDLGDGTIWGPSLTGSINYQTGALTLEFPANHVAPPGTTITVNYVQNGWAIGTGLLDEDGRPSHQTWIGADFTYLKNTQNEVKEDLNNYLYEVASHYFSVCKSKIQAWMPGALFLGPDSLGSWGAPPPAQVLQAASHYLDVVILGGGAPVSQAALDFIYQNLGDKPLLIGTFQTANADSAFYGDHASIALYDFPSQSSRGLHYEELTRSFSSMAYSENSSRPFVGILWWQYLDNPGEKNNWGLVSLLDNAYDGHEAVRDSVSCSPPLQRFRCGGEARDYGDVIDPVKAANQQILDSLQHF
jgi:hypothetical protein